MSLDAAPNFTYFFVSCIGGLVSLREIEATGEVEVMTTYT